MTAPATQSVFTAIDRIHQRVADGQYYDGYQLCCSLVARFCSRRQVTEASELCTETAEVLAAAKQFDLASSVAVLLITKVFQGFALPVTKERISLILRLFAVAESTGFVEERYRFIDKAIRWAGSSYTELHRAAGLAALRDEQFGRAQIHLIHWGDCDALRLLLQRWSAIVYPSEKDLLILRAVLIILAKGDVLLALKLIAPRNLHLLGIDLSDENIIPPAAVQLAFLLTHACSLRSEAFFDLLISKYHLVLRRDGGFSKYIQVIERKIFSRQQAPGWENNIVNLLGSLTMSH